MMKRPYTEGSVFLVPLAGGGYARGVVARVSRKGGVLVGFFFGPRLDSAETVPLEGLVPDRSILRVQFGDLGLIRGKWPICGTVPDWHRDRWRMQDFVRRDELTNRAWRVRYSDMDPSQREEEQAVGTDCALPPDELYGFGAVEAVLSTLVT